MSTGKPLPLKELIGGSDSVIGDLIERSSQVEALTREVRGLVPERLRPHILTACLRDDTLSLVTDAAVWATELRYRASDIRTSLQAKQGRSLQKVRVRVRAPAGKQG